MSEPLKFRVERDMKDRWDELLERKKITQQNAGVALVEWLLDSDDLLQSMVLGQVKPSDDLPVLIARRLAKSKRNRPLKVSLEKKEEQRLAEVQRLRKDQNRQ